MIARLAVALVLLAVPAGAQTWSFVTDPSDQSGMAILFEQRRPVISLHCLRDGFDAATFTAASGSEALPRAHDPGNAVVTVYPGRSDADPEPGARARLILRVGRERFALRGARRDADTGQVFAEMPLDGAEVEALRRGTRLRVILREAGERFDASLRGSDAALSALQDYCAQPLRRATPDRADRVRPAPERATPERPAPGRVVPPLAEAPLAEAPLSKAPKADDMPPSVTVEPLPPAVAEAVEAPDETDAPDPDRPLDPVEAALDRDFGEAIANAFWFENPEPSPAEALAFVYAPIEGGNALSLTVALYRLQGGEWLQAGVVRELFGADPREAEFREDAIAVTTTTPKPDDPRCCPTGETRWLVDRATLVARPAQ
jgi:hypothetical protein